MHFVCQDMRLALDLQKLIYGGANKCSRTKLFSCYLIFNRPRVAGAVLQSPP